MTQSQRFPTLYIPHGGGPLPLLGEPSHQALVTFLQRITNQIGKPSLIVVVSAHWETAQPTLTSHPSPPLLFDYFGFPPESYQLHYPAPGAPVLAQQLRQDLVSAGFDAQLDGQRGFDHGLFVPLLLMYPDASIPCLQLSLLHNLDPAQHIQLGRSIAHWRERGVLIIGSGMSFHNMQAFYDRDDSPQGHAAAAFHDWLGETCCDPALTVAQRDERLSQWVKAPGARYCHPREEHLLPLHVCWGAAGEDAAPARQVFDDKILGKRVMALLWD